MPDVIGLAAFLRILVVTPISLLLVFFISRVSPELREWLVTVGALGGTIVPAYLFYRTNAPLGAYMIGDLNLMLAYANLLLALRFRHAFLFTLGALVTTYSVVVLKPGLDQNLQIAFMIQLTSACIFTLYANYLLERRRCEDYITARIALIRAEAAEISSLELHEISMTDALTDLPNRRFLDGRLEDWFEQSGSIAVMMIDVDHFKLFNDTLGHPAGDDCLRKVASVLMLATHSSDMFCARFGGEEFTVAVRDIGELEAARLANSIIRSIEALEIVHPGRSDGVGVVTVSIGVAFKPWGRASSKAAVLSQADEALYRAKRRGRNCFEITDKMVAPASGSG